MAKYIKTRKGNDGFYYPYTSPDLVIDEDGKSATTKFNEINTQLENIGQSTQEQINTAIDKAIEEGKMHSDASKLSIIDTNNNFMSDNVEGALEELNTQCKDIAKQVENLEISSGLVLVDVSKNDIFSIKSNGDTPSEIVYGNIIVSNNTLTINKNGVVTLSIKLDKAPTNNQIINLNVNNTDCTLDKNSLIFTSSNYSTEQIVTITNVTQKNTSSIITISSENVTSKTVNINIKNTEESGELQTSITNGLTHMYDFTKLTTASTQSNDMVGSSNINVPTEFAGDGYLLGKNKHLNIGNLLDTSFTVLLAVKIKYQYKDSVSYTFYCGDRSIMINRIKVGTQTQNFNNFSIKPKNQVLCIKYNNDTKTVYAYVGGKLISSMVISSVPTDNAIYLSFNTNKNCTIENYHLLVYNKVLSDSEISTVSEEIKVDYDYSNIPNISVTESLMDYYDFDSLEENETEIISKVGNTNINITGNITVNNGLILGTDSQNLSSGVLPFNNRGTIILKTTVPSSSTKGNKVIEFNNVLLSLSKTNYSLKFGTATSNTYVPEQDKINVFALSFDINENFAKLYRNGTLIETISCDGYNIENDCYYMLANDMIHHALLIYDKALSTEQIATLTNDLGGVN